MHEAVEDGAARLRNRDGAGRGAGAGDPRVAALVRLVRAVARREVLAGYEIVAGGGTPTGGLAPIETWRGPRFAAHVVEAGRDAGAGPDTGAHDAAALAGTMFDGEGRGRVAAVWLAPAGAGPSGGRLAVLVVETPGRGDPR